LSAPFVRAAMHDRVNEMAVAFRRVPQAEMMGRLRPERRPAAEPQGLAARPA